MEKEKDAPAVNDEVELDKELDSSIKEFGDAVKAGDKVEPLVQPKPEVKAEVLPAKVEEKPAETKVEPPSTAPVDEAKKEPGYEFRIPNKGKFESDESYEKRIELLDLVKRRKLSKTDEQRHNLSEQIQTAKNQLKSLSGVDKISNPLNSNVEGAKPEIVEDEAMKADKERLKQLGGATKDDIAEVVRQERIAADTKNTLERFVERYPEFKDVDVREVFFDFVDSNYNWNGKTGKALMTVLELARENMFKPSESIQERVLKGANVQEKINAMQFPGGTLAKDSYSPEMRKSIDELKATGMSEEKALELLSE